MVQGNTPSASRARLARAEVVLAAATLLAGCATRIIEAPPSGSMTRTLEEPLRDLSLIREVAPEVLVNAVAAPYRAPPGCPSLEAELRALDKALGPDVDASRPQLADSLVMDLVTGGIGGLVNLPYGGIIRRVTGAYQREKAYRAAVLGGMVRRAFLKGSRRGLQCVAADAPSD